MTPKKLSDSEKQEIASSYGGGGVTMASLAKTFGVSASTVSRILRQAEMASPVAESSQTEPEPEPEPEPEAELAVESSPPSPKPSSTRKRRSRTTVSKAAPNKVTPKTPESGAADEGDPVESSASEAEPETTTIPLPTTEIKTKRTRKRSTPRAAVSGAPKPEPKSPPVPADPVPPEAAEEEGGDDQRSRRRVRRRSRSSAADEPQDTSMAVADSPEEEEDDSVDYGTSAPEVTASRGESEALDSDLSEDDLDDLDDDGADLDDDYGDDYDDDDEDDDEEGDEDSQALGGDSEQPLQVLPFADVSLPNPCYLVVDRSAELITRPLREFRDLGAVPDAEADFKTLPIFDNHRIARRFSARNQRVIKVPDSTIFFKTSPHLQEKRIARLVVDGRVYAL